LISPCASRRRSQADAYGHQSFTRICHSRLASLRTATWILRSEIGLSKRTTRIAESHSPKNRVIKFLWKCFSGRTESIGPILKCVSEYALTDIYQYGYILVVESSFAIVAEPNRRAILSLLLSSERSVGEIERKLRLSQPSVSKHLRVLRKAGFVESRIEAQRRLYRLRPEPLMELDAWLVPFRRFWSKHVDALEQHLEKMKKVPRVKGKKRRERS
jgi:DNA-binding transcriptional ArsR family regulator